jgi:MAC/Perforin domain
MTSIDQEPDIMYPPTKASASLRLLRAESSLAENTLPGVEAIGAGYDPFLKYACADSITVQVFDWTMAPTKSVTIDGKTYQVPSVVDVQSHNAYNYTEAYGDSINLYQTSLATTVEASGGYNFFSGSLSVEYNTQSLTRSENAFSRIQQSITTWSLRLQRPAEELRSLLLPSFRKYLDDLPRTEAAAAGLFNRYGSHFLTGIVMGGRAVLSSATNKLQVSRSHSIEETAKASYKSLTGQLTVEEKAKYQKSIESFNSTSASEQAVLGGTQASRAFDGKAGFSAWAASVANAPDFVNFVSTIPMDAMWRLCATEQQSAFLENYYSTVWAPARSQSYQLYADYVDALVVISGSNSNVAPPIGYTKIPYDLNKGAGGKFIYLCYHKASYQAFGKNKQCIDSLVIIYGRNTQPPAGYTKLPQDLNEGAGGEYVYLCYRQADWANDIAIKDVTVVGGSSSNVPPPYGYQKVPGDLNKGAGGDFIYVCYSLTG